MIFYNVTFFIFQESEPKQALYEHITIVYEINFLKCGRKLTSDVWNVAKSSGLWSDPQATVWVHNTNSVEDWCNDG